MSTGKTNTSIVPNATAGKTNAETKDPEKIEKVKEEESGGWFGCCGGGRVVTAEEKLIVEAKAKHKTLRVRTDALTAAFSELGKDKGFNNVHRLEILNDAKKLSADCKAQVEKLQKETSTEAKYQLEIAKQASKAADAKLKEIQAAVPKNEEVKSGTEDPAAVVVDDSAATTNAVVVDDNAAKNTEKTPDVQTEATGEDEKEEKEENKTA